MMIAMPLVLLCFGVLVAYVYGAQGYLANSAAYVSRLASLYAASAPLYNAVSTSWVYVPNAPGPIYATDDFTANLVPVYNFSECGIADVCRRVLVGHRTEILVVG